MKAELGKKRTCPSCAARFYDLLKQPILCPKCGTSFVAAIILPSKSDLPAAANLAAKPHEVARDKTDIPDVDVDLVSLEDVEEADETAGIEDVDIGEAAVTVNTEEDDTFLVEEEEDSSAVSSLIVTPGTPNNEEEL